MSKWSVNPKASCNLCGNSGAITFTHSLYPDFDLEKYEDIPWINKFKNAEDGVCMTCGHFQRFTRLTEEELKEYELIFSDKSKTNEGIVSSSRRIKEEEYRSNLIEILQEKYFADESPAQIYVARPTSASILGRMQNIFECKE